MNLQFKNLSLGSTFRPDQIKTTKIKNDPLNGQKNIRIEIKHRREKRNVMECPESKSNETIKIPHIMDKKSDCVQWNRRRLI